MVSASITLPVYPIDEQVVRYFHECVRRIREYTTDYQLIVVQNGGEPLDFSGQGEDEFLYASLPWGYTRALNAGLAWTRGHYLGAISADVMVGPGWLDTLKKELNEHGPGVICPSDADTIAGVVDAGWGACWLTTKDVYAQVGPHDELLCRFSDQDWWIRCRQAGFKVLRTGSVRVTHDDGSTVKKIPEEVARWPLDEQRMREKHGVATYEEWKRQCD